MAPDMAAFLAELDRSSSPTVAMVFMYCWRETTKAWLTKDNSVLDSNERTFTGLVRARHVNPTPADLGGVTSFLYELEHRYKHSFLVMLHR